MSSVSRISKSASAPSLNASKSVVKGSSRASDFSKSISKTCAAKYRATVKSRDAIVVQVVDKLRKLPDYIDSDHSELESIAFSITDSDALKQNFSHLYTSSCQVISEALSDDEDVQEEAAGPTEIVKKHERAKERMEVVCDLPIKLCLRKLNLQDSDNLFKVSSLLNIRFGPLHAALRVGDVLIEWDTSSLIIPRSVSELSSEAKEFFFMSDIRQLSAFRRTANALKTTDCEVEVLISKNEDKVKLIDNLVAVISKYNRKYYYNVVSRNCQHFVASAAKALGIKEKLAFNGKRLNNHFETLKATGKVDEAQLSKFSTHADVDVYVMARDRQGKLQHDKPRTLEYLHALYVFFHSENDSQVSENDLTHCDIPDCMQRRLVELLEPHLRRLKEEEDEEEIANVYSPSEASSLDSIDSLGDSEDLTESF